MTPSLEEYFVKSSSLKIDVSVKELIPGNATKE